MYARMGNFIICVKTGNSLARAPAPIAQAKLPPPSLKNTKVVYRTSSQY